MPEYKPVYMTLKRRDMAHGGRSVYPDFRALSEASPGIFDGKRPGAYFNEDCDGPHTSNHGLGKGAAYGEAVILIPQPNADQLIAAVGYEGNEDVSSMTEVELDRFWLEEAYDDQPSAVEDTEVLQAIAAKQSIGITLSPEDRAALDVDDPRPGRRKNEKYVWARYKSVRDITIV